MDNIVESGRKERSGPKGYRPSSIFMALLLMYLQSMERMLDLVRFLNVHNQLLVTLNLNKTVHREIKYKVPDREYLLQVCWKAWRGEDAGNIRTYSNSADKPRYNQRRKGKP